MVDAIAGRWLGGAQKGETTAKKREKKKANVKARMKARLKRNRRPI